MTARPRRRIMRTMAGSRETARERRESATRACAITLAAAAAGLSSLGGCWAAHARGPADDAGALDAGPPPIDAAPPPLDAHAPVDAWRPIDAGPEDAGARCEGATREVPQHVCLFRATGALPAGAPSSLLLTYSACLCEVRACVARVEGGAISLETWTCPEPEECDECTRELTCEVPAAEAGEYALVLDGRSIGTIEARPDRPVSVAHPTCWGIQEALDPALECPLRSAAPGEGAIELCHRTLEDVGTFARIELRYRAPACEPPGECRAWLDGRLVRVAWAPLACAPECEGEPPIAHSVHCVSPALRDGDYEIVVEGSPALRSSLEVRDVFTPGPTRCVGVTGGGGAIPSAR